MFEFRIVADRQVKRFTIYEEVMLYEIAHYLAGEDRPTQLYYSNMFGDNTVQQRRLGFLIFVGSNLLLFVLFDLH